MIRSVAIIAKAIALSQPGMSKATRHAYATIVHDEARDHGFDPFTAVAIVHNESRWIASTIGGLNGACYGLGQRCAHVVPVCREQGVESEACVAHMSRYLDGAFALRTLAGDISANRRVCRELTGEPALFARWLSSYQGFNDHAPSGRSDVWCNMRRDRRGVWRDVSVPALTQKVMRYRLRLIERLAS